MKRLILIVCLVLGTFAAVGCATDEIDSSSDAPETSAPVPRAEINRKTGELEWSDGGGGPVANIIAPPGYCGPDGGPYEWCGEDNDGGSGGGGSSGGGGGGGGGTTVTCQSYPGYPYASGQNCYLTAAGYRLAVHYTDHQFCSNGSDSFRYWTVYTLQACNSLTDDPIDVPVETEICHGGHPDGCVPPPTVQVAKPLCESMTDCGPPP